MDSVMVMDTSAWFTLAEAEAGADEVEAYWAEAWLARVTVHASFVSLAELEYIRTQEQGPESAAELIAWVEKQPVQWHHSDDVLCSAAAKLKAAHRISFSDSFVAALAQRLDATLVHKDPEFNALGGVLNLDMLPPK